MSSDNDYIFYDLIFGAVSFHQTFLAALYNSRA